jgi:hemerythrin superfamily protein
MKHDIIILSSILVVFMVAIIFGNLITSQENLEQQQENITKTYKVAQEHCYTEEEYIYCDIDYIEQGDKNA